ncbi:unnamed protein product [Rotaria socialis]|uniref:Ribosomal RNA methyltransferase FtsJ domain-containing protein n=3 Tax=Rotaria socialis TaxID=392032 RepID=A0A818H0J0_9BILA|nr:unnamed protein product [Rotaria socialis]CAF4495753.1 unnamed protein product [Rotaria socialis]
MASSTSVYIPPHRRNVESLQKCASVINSTPLINEVDLVKFDFFYKHLYNNSVLLRRLYHIRNIYKEDPNTEEHFTKRRITCGKAPSEFHLNTFIMAMEEIESNNNICLVSQDRIKHFLDLGCAPGGFSRWIIENNPSCTGLGITLPPDLGGFHMVFDAPGRYRYLYEDVTKNPETIWCQDGVYQGIEPQFDLCIAGCIFRSPEINENSDDDQPACSRSRRVLRYSQLLTALTNLQKNGTLILVFNIRPFLFQVEILCLLSCCFESLLPVKPKRVHIIRSSYYLIGVNYKPEKAQKMNLLGRLRTVLDFMKKADSSWHYDNALLMEGTPDQIITEWTPFVLEHYQPMWEVQMNAIEHRLFPGTKKVKTGYGWPLSNRRQTVDKTLPMQKSINDKWR